jgi:hypothetical protein
MPCIGILGLRLYHNELPKELMDMIYKNQNWLSEKFNMDLFSHLKLSHYNTRQGRHSYKNLPLNIYTITYKNVELDFYLTDNPDGYIYFVYEATRAHRAIDYIPPTEFNEFIETLKFIEIDSIHTDGGFFVLEE